MRIIRLLAAVFIACLAAAAWAPADGYSLVMEGSP